MLDNKTLTHSDTKPHYHVLDGLRGVAALMVLVYHLFEAHATDHMTQVINHGYLAVDFFFILSGFVVSYAYDDRWGSMSVWAFVKRRIIRLHPLVVLGAVIGGALFYLQGCAYWNVAAVSLGTLLVAVLMNALIIPATPGNEVRGFGEMFPLNGPHWSLFFEYIASLMYALLLRRLPTLLLGVFVGLSAVGLGAWGLTNDLQNLGGGWTMLDNGFLAGMLRVSFSFSAGMLLARLYRPIHLKGAMWLAVLSIVVLTAMPRIGGETYLWMNALYDLVCVILAFPLLVYIGAGAQITNPSVERWCRRLGDLSYPLYAVHYPLLYTYYAWVKNGGYSFSEALPGAAAFIFGSIALAVLSLYLYDLPVRRWLMAKFG